MGKNLNNLCYNCFEELSDANEICMACKYNNLQSEDNFPLALSRGSILGGRYILGRVLGQGGFGITYVAFDHITNSKVAIKEYVPGQIVTRFKNTASIQTISVSYQEQYINGLHSFLEEAQMLARFNAHENIVSVKSYFEENATAYFVMEYIEGKSFKEYIKQNGGIIGYDQTINILTPIMRALTDIHKENVLHRDVTPDNIYITADNKVKLLDFGSSRYVSGEQSKSLDVVLKPGYAPIEQYMRRGKQGPFTDVYSLGACFYASIVGILPAESLERISSSESLSIKAHGIDIPDYLENAIFKALEVEPQNRWQNIEEFKSAIENLPVTLENPNTAHLVTSLSMPLTSPPSANVYDINNHNFYQNNYEASNENENAKQNKIKLLTVFAAAFSVVFMVVFIFVIYNLVNGFRISDNTNQTAGVNQNEQINNTLSPEDTQEYVANAYELYNSMNYDECISYIENDLALGKEFDVETQSKLSEILGAAYFEKKDYAAAASFFRLSTAGGDITVPAMRDYAVSLGRLGDIDAAKEILDDMFAAGADEIVTRYVNAEVLYAQQNYVEAESVFLQILDEAQDNDLKRRAMRSVAELYRDCTVLEKMGTSPIQQAASKQVNIIETYMSQLGFNSDSTIWEMLGLAYYESYQMNNNDINYLISAASCFENVINMGITKDYLYTNLFNIYFQIGDYDSAQHTLLQMQEMFNSDYTPYALRSVLLISIENSKPENERNFSDAYEQYNIAKSMVKSSDDTTYLMQVESLIEDLIENGWI